MPSRAVIYGKYELLQRINVGGMAEVFKARLVEGEGRGQFCAIKRILPSIAEDRDFINMFIDEAKITERLKHPNIAQTYELGRSNDTYYIAMEYVAGKDLRTLFERLRRQNAAVPPELAAFVVSRVAAGLDYAHRQTDPDGKPLGIVHRDISPQNVLMSFDGEVKVIDFGIAKVENKIQQTQVGILKGKFGYMSPEQVAGKRIDSRSDLFALGVVFFELLSGERLFVGTNDHSVLDKVRNVEVPTLTDVRKGIPPALQSIVAHLLTKSPDERYQNGGEVEADLRNYLNATGRPFTEDDLAGFMQSTFPEDFEYERRGASGPAFEEPVDWPRAVPSVSVPRIRSTLLKHDQRPNLEGAVAALPPEPGAETAKPPRLATAALTDDTDPTLQEPLPPPPIEGDEATAIKRVSPADDARSNLELTPEALMLEAEIGLEQKSISRMAGLNAPRRPEPAPRPLPSVITELNSESSAGRTLRRTPSVEADNEPTRVAPVPPETLRSTKAKEPTQVLYQPPRQIGRKVSSFASLIVLLLVAVGIGVIAVKWWWPVAKPKGGYSKLDLFAAPGFAALQVTTDPPDAEVLLDGLRVKPGGFQPFTSEHIDTEMAHEVIARKAGYREAVEKVNLGRGESLGITLKLEPLQAVLKVETNPPNAEVWVDGRLEGHSGESIGTVASGNHQLRVALDCYAPVEQPIVLGQSDLALKFELRPVPGSCAFRAVRHATDKGLVRLYSTPVAKVIIDEQDTGRTTPLVDFPLAPGHHLVRFVTEDGAKAVDINVEAGKPMTETVSIEKQWKKAHVEPEPPTAPTP